jgi:peptidoglycan hydrolase-like protein with peptidoglycan-binding domain
MANDAATLNRSTAVNRTAAAKNEAATTVDTSSIKEGLKAGAGMTGAPDPAVNQLQQALNAQQGAGLKPDGRFGPKTEAAVRAFQEKNGIEPSGVICNETLAKIQGKTVAATENAPAAEETAATEEATTQQPARTQASQTDVEASRSKMKSREEMMRARVAGAERAEANGEGFETVTDGTVKSTLEGVQQMKGSLEDQRRQVSSLRVGVQADIRALAEKRNRTEPENMLLTGKRQQDEVLGQLEKLIDTKKSIVDAAGTAVSDGIITESEDKGIATASEISQRAERMLATKAKAADAVVAGAIRLGATIPQRASVANANASTVSNEPVATANRPAVSNQPRVSNEPVATANRPAVSNQPRVSNEPVATANRPAVSNQPRVSNEPAATANRPAVSNQPRVANEPAVAANRPAAAAQETFAQLSQKQVDDAVGAVRAGAGTKAGVVSDGAKVLAALDGLSPNQVKQVEDAYNKKFPGSTFQKDVVGNLNPPSQRAVAALRDESKTQAARTSEFKKLSGEGNALQARLKTDAAAIRSAVAGAGTDEQKLFDTLNKYAGNKEEFALLEKEYGRQFTTGAARGSTGTPRNLREDVRDDVDGDELVRANALMDQNKPLANAGYAHEVLARGDVKELARHLSSIPAAERKAFADAFKKQYGATLSSTVESQTRNRYFNTGDMAKLLDAVKSFPAS